MSGEQQTVEQPQIYLITPEAFELSRFSETLARCLDTVPVACVRLALATTDEDEISRAADALRMLTHARDVALVIERHVALVERLGLDGVHLTDAARSVAKMRKVLGQDFIVGTHCAASRHDGMTAAETGADYVSFGPATASLLGDGSVAEYDLFAWWSEMIEVPVVAEGGLTEDMLHRLSPVVDFFGIGAELWRTDAPASTLRTFAVELAL
ncbi:MAG: thiamine phosphate synthase [Pseudomonadota bacterium]